MNRFEHPVLSICIPLFNHAERLKQQFVGLEGVGVGEAVEFVIVDDGSTDDVLSAVEFIENGGWNTKLLRQTSNRGRASAIAMAVGAATGSFVMLMDADDAYEPIALQEILYDLASELSDPNSGLAGFVYGTATERQGRRAEVRPPAGLRCSLLALRSDFGVKGELKEVVRRELLFGALCSMFNTYRRVPTSLLWARISNVGLVQCMDRVVVNKVYLPGGMTKTLNVYRLNSTPPLLELYRTISYSNSYKSVRYRVRATLNYHRFLAWSANKEYKFLSGWRGWLGLPSYLYGAFEVKFRGRK